MERRETIFQIVRTSRRRSWSVRVSFGRHGRQIAATTSVSAGRPAGRSGLSAISRTSSRVIAGAAVRLISLGDSRIETITNRRVPVRPFVGRRRSVLSC